MVYSPTTWGTNNVITRDKLNKIEQGVVASSLIPPIGMISIWPGASTPDDWLDCNGQAVSRTAYADLFTVIGTQFGAGDGSTTFNVPNLKGRVIAGLDTGQAEFDSIGKTGGAKAHQLSIDEMPSHSHEIEEGNGLTTTPPRGGFASDVGQGYMRGSEPTGGGKAHNNMPPYLVLRYLIRAK